MRVNLAGLLLRSEINNLKGRNALIPRGKWRLATAMSQMTRYIEDAYRTIPTEQLMTIKRSLQDTSYTVGVRCPATRDRNRDREYGVVVPIGALNAIFAACGEHCLMCMGNGEEQRRCKLRKALDEIPNDVQARDDGGCPYQGALIRDADDAEVKCDG